ncbi:MAG: hypothetical protein B7733_25705 [Myxococcales bacterium FL481]|nr:MAG: hypothetical protein B7733_25705 [Myxococcales bacterium FL481]
MHTHKKFGTFALTMVPLLAALSVCASGEPRPPARAIGSTSFRYELEPGVNIDEIRFSIAHAGEEIESGTVLVGDEQTVRFAIDDLPVGRSELAVSAASTDRTWLCWGHVPFEIVAGERSLVEVVMSCERSDSGGSVDVEVALNVCPRVTALSATPSAAFVGEPIHLRAEADDADADPVSILWSAAGNVFAAGSDAVYPCETVGLVPLLVSASDEHCSVERVITVECRAEELDAYWPPASPGCDACMFDWCGEDVFGEDVNLLCPPEDLECRGVYDCYRESECFSPTRGVVECYCGTVDPIECLGPHPERMPDGPCVDLIQPGPLENELPDEDGWSPQLVGGGTPWGRAGLAIVCMMALCSEPCGVPGA